MAAVAAVIVALATVAAVNAVAAAVESVGDAWEGGRARREGRGREVLEG